MTAAHHPQDEMRAHQGPYSHSNPRTRKLNPEQVREIVRLYEAGATYKDLCEQFSVTSNAICYRLHQHVLLRSERHR